MRHSETRGIRLLGSVEMKRHDVSVCAESKNVLVQDLVKAHMSGPALRLTAKFSISESLPTGTRSSQIQLPCISGDLLQLQHDLQVMNAEADKGHQADYLQLWLMHERILLSPSTIGHLGELLHNLGGICLKHWKTSRKIHFLNQSVCAYEDAVADDGKATYLQDLTFASYHHVQEHSMVDIDKAVQVHKDALHLTTSSDSCWFGITVNLASLLQVRFQHCGDLKDLDESITMGRELVHIAPDDCATKANTLSNLGNSLLLRFMHLGDLGDLDECMSRQEEAVGLAPNNLDKVTKLNNLGNALAYRFQRFDDINALNECISKLKDAVQLAPDDYHNKPTILSNLGNALQYRFTRLMSGEPPVRPSIRPSVRPSVRPAPAHRTAPLPRPILRPASGPAPQPAPPPDTPPPVPPDSAPFRPSVRPYVRPFSLARAV
ncbi:hypothetical protein K438DRAFT_1849191, partial [Mycena galopus ATCC 62051]